MRIAQSAKDGDHLVIDNIALAGEPIATPSICIPVKLVKGIRAPMELALPGNTSVGRPTCVTDEGVVFISGDPGVLVFDSDGSELPSLTDPAVSAIGCCALAHDPLSKTLLLCLRQHGRGAPMIAVDLTTGRVRWESEPVLRSCYCLAALPHAGIVVGSSDGSKEIYAVDMSGSVVASHHCDESVFVATDATTNTVYVSSTEGYVDAFRWDTAARIFSPLGRIESLPHFNGYRPLTVVPPIPGGCVSHLVVGCLGNDTICVLSLPSLTFIGQTVSGYGNVDGLAADFAGTAIIIFAGGVANVRPWPLPGLPSLE